MAWLDGVGAGPRPGRGRSLGSYPHHFLLARNHAMSRNMPTQCFAAKTRNGQAPHKGRLKCRMFRHESDPALRNDGRTSLGIHGPNRTAETHHYAINDSASTLRVGPDRTRAPLGRWTDCVHSIGAEPWRPTARSGYGRTTTAPLAQLARRKRCPVYDCDGVGSIPAIPDAHYVPSLLRRERNEASCPAAANWANHTAETSGKRTI